MAKIFRSTNPSFLCSFFLSDLDLGLDLISYLLSSLRLPPPHFLSSELVDDVCYWSLSASPPFKAPSRTVLLPPLLLREREMMDLKTLVTRTLEKKGVLAKIRIVCSWNSPRLHEGVVHLQPPQKALEKVKELVWDPTTSSYGPDEGLPDLRAALQKKEFETDKQIIHSRENKN